MRICRIHKIRQPTCTRPLAWHHVNGVLVLAEGIFGKLSPAFIWNSGIHARRQRIVVLPLRILSRLETAAFVFAVVSFHAVNHETIARKKKGHYAIAEKRQDVEILFVLARIGVILARILVQIADGGVDPVVDAFFLIFGIYTV